MQKQIEQKNKKKTIHTHTKHKTPEKERMMNTNRCTYPNARLPSAHYCAQKHLLSICEHSTNKTHFLFWHLLPGIDNFSYAVASQLCYVNPTREERTHKKSDRIVRERCVNVFISVFITLANNVLEI